MIGFNMIQIRTELKDWDPIRDTQKHQDLFQTWKDLLDGPECILTTEDCPSITSYERLVWEEWMPLVRRGITEWNVHDCDPLIGISFDYSSRHSEKCISF